MWQAVERVRTVLQIVVALITISAFLAVSVYLKWTVSGWVTVLLVGLGIAAGFVWGWATHSVQPLAAEEAPPKDEMPSQPVFGGVIINGMLDGDPRIYLDIKLEKTDFRDRFICHNQGKDTAHNVQIQPITLAGHKVTFNSIGVIGAGQTGIAVPSIEGAGGLTGNMIFHWLIQDWDKGNQLVGEWPVQMKVTYTNALNNREFTGTSTLMFYPIKYNNLIKHKKPITEKMWDFKNPQFISENL
jgi:hypothetical protein